MKQQSNKPTDRLPASPVYYYAFTFALALALLAGCTGANNPGQATATSAVPTIAASATNEPTQPPTPGETVEPGVTVEPPTEEPTINNTTFPDPDGFTWAPYLTGLLPITDMTVVDDGSNRLFVLEKVGRVRLVSDEQLQDQPFLDLTDRVGSGSSEQGLLGIAFHPNYAENGLLFVNYTDVNGDSVVSQFSVSGDPNLADPHSEHTLLKLDQPFANHNGGGVVFGPDGMLYLSFGDGGSGGDPLGNGQNPNTLFGSILRINPDLQGGYTIPQDNPFVSGGGLPEVWQYGLRNPWRFSFDRATGDLYIADVGQNQYEEIDFVAGGAAGALNFGWNYYEGNHLYTGQPPENVDFVFPIHEYSHSDGCSVTGGYIYRGQSLPEFQGIYLYGDYCTGSVWGLLRDAGGQWQNQLLFNTGSAISSFAQDNQGEVYLLSLGQGSIFRLQRR